MNRDDSEIIALFGEEGQKENAFGLLMEKYQERLYHHIRKIVISHEDTDDILQEVFIKAWRHLHSFREESGLYTWLFRIATNESLNLLRKKKKNSGFSIDNFPSLLADKLAEDPLFRGDELALKLQKAILTLPEKQRIIFNMKYFDDMKYEEISDILGTSEGALKASYHHAVKKIKAYFDLG